MTGMVSCLAGRAFTIREFVFRSWMVCLLVVADLPIPTSLVADLKHPTRMPPMSEWREYASTRGLSLEGSFLAGQPLAAAISRQPAK